MRPIYPLLCLVLCLALPVGGCSVWGQMSSVFGEKTPAPEATAPQTPVTQLPAAKAPAPPPSAQNAVLRPSVQNEASRPAAQADMLKPGDALHITVAGEDELSGAFAVNSDGTIRMELLGSVQAAGLSPAALQEQLQQRLAAGYLKNPQVRVERSAKLAVAPPILRPSL